MPRDLATNLGSARHLAAPLILRKERIVCARKKVRGRQSHGRFFGERRFCASQRPMAADLGKLEYCLPTHVHMTNDA